MNKIICSTEYITPSRTLETVVFKNNDRILYIYKYEGVHFRLFTELFDVIKFFKTGTEPQYSFTKEQNLDLFEEYLK